MLDFIHRNLDDNKKPTAVLGALVDFSKAFNRIDHNVIVTILADLNVPTCALRLIMSYLSNRKMCVRFNGAVSADQDIPGGGPQGGLLTVLLFNLQVNLAGQPCPLRPLQPAGLDDHLQARDLASLPPVPAKVDHPHVQIYGPLPPCHQKEKTLKKKYVDDLTLMEALSLLSTLLPSPVIIGPPNLHEFPGLELPADQSILQHQLGDLAVFTAEHGMKINYKKTKIIPFNFSKKYEFLPQLSFPNGIPIEVIYETRLLGVTISSNLSWASHVNDITTRATKKLWVLVRFKSLGGTTQQLLIIYVTRIRSTLEFASPVFHSGLTKEQSHQIELVQKKSLAIILANRYSTYEDALAESGLERLDKRREKLCLSFAQKCTKSTKHQSMFPQNPTLRVNTRNPKPYKEYNCNTSRYYNSPLPYLARLLNRSYESTS